MTDLEITRACAEAMGYEDVHIAHGCMGTAYVKCGGRGSVTRGIEFRPLKDDAQAMALVKKFQMQVNFGFDKWCVHVGRGSIPNFSESADLNRAICECMAKMRGKP